jgi:hypothetical protein
LNYTFIIWKKLQRADEEVRRVERGVPDSEAEGLEHRVPELKEHERRDTFMGDSGCCSPSSSFFFFLDATVSL